jgi:dipeptidyl aminopeptidase/acylaminoacyl peptidase
MAKIVYFLLNDRPVSGDRGGKVRTTLKALLAAVSILVSSSISAAATAPMESGTISPDHLRLVWSLPGCHCLFGVRRATPTAPWGLPEKIFDIRGAIDHIVFSPDGARIAFDNIRGDLTVNNGQGDSSLRGFDPARAYLWSFIAIYDFKTGRIDYIDPTFSYDSAPEWSASGREISFTRHIDGQADKRLSRSPLEGDATAQGTTATGALVGSMLAAPVVFQPVASNDGRVLVYGAREGAVRTIYAKAQSQPARRLVFYGDDDGQELRNMALSPKGDVLTYVRGGFPNRNGDDPNPLSMPIKPRHEIWIVGTDGAKSPLKASVGDEPQFTPDGTSLAWIDAQGLMIAPLIRGSSGLEGLGPASKVIGGPISGVRFAPGGGRLLYKSGDSVGVYDLGKDTTWIIARPKDAIDSQAVWSPDGRRIAFVRTTGTQPMQIDDGLLGNGGPFTSAVPWAIIGADVDSMKTKTLWQASPGRGSAYFPLDQDPTGVGYAGVQLLWAADGKVIFEWEVDGWRHLYEVPETGGKARLLTPGEGDVETAALSMDGRYVFAATNIGDLARRHLNRVEIATGAIVPVTSGETSQWAPTALANGALAYIDAGWADPPAIRLWRQGGGSTSTKLPAVAKTFPRDLFVRPELVDIIAADGSKAYGQLFRPIHPTGCGVVFAHGGIQRQMLPGFHYIEMYSNLYEINQYLVSQGCAVLSIEYRSSIMRGYEYRNAPGWGNAGASEMNDVVGAAKFLKSDATLKVRHVGIWGLSWGGYITAQALAMYPNVFEAGFDAAGVHEFFGDRFKYSPVASVAKWRSPIFLVHADDDRNVDFYQSLSLARALSARADIEAVFRAVPDEIHGINLLFQDLVSVYGEGADFLIDHLTESRIDGGGRTR